MSIILAVDPGYDRLGIAVLDCSLGVGKEKIVFSECVETSPKDDFPKRLRQIYDSVAKIIATQKPKVLAIENIYITKNQKTAMKVAEVRGVVILAAENAGLQIFEYSPPEIKLAVTGHGGSDKKQVENMVRKLIFFEKENVLDDELDAVAIGLTCSAIDNSRLRRK